MNIIDKIKSLNNVVFNIITGENCTVEIDEEKQIIRVPLRITNSFTNSFSIIVDKNGRFKEGADQIIFPSKGADQIIFPSKGNRDWDSIFVCPFKDGELVAISDSEITSSNVYVRKHTGRMKGSLHLCYQKPDRLISWKYAMSLEEFKEKFL